MSHARQIAQSTRSAPEAAAAIRETLARITPDLVADSGAWAVQADMLAGAVASCASELGHIGRDGRTSTRYADAIRAALGVTSHGSA